VPQEAGAAAAFEQSTVWAPAREAKEEEIKRVLMLANFMVLVCAERLRLRVRYFGAYVT
jgi:hypothetical protein